MTPVPLARRALVRLGASALVLGPLARTGQASASVETASGAYLRSRFTPYLGRQFRLGNGSRAWVLRLTAVDDLPSAAAGAEGSFSLTFSARSAGPPQGTYTLRRAGFAATTLFVVAVDASGRTVEAVVNNG
ncbi:DUF6916 family protein [Nocardioides ferulae]|uniref:DUF6916 family protein n=1 Tax=Nocardioides ferulae TaxID=2340821 RepID=UPI000F89C077|nr:hypothetical protein [Nocardioides ferulae]